ncbi:hypothetical protein T484DRAFT_1860348 [Baffinella frigidus]|nr:hypothetical protein T484DRAFT_1860348 [Cryptophyta sp. CCMP2293]
MVAVLCALLSRIPDHRDHAQFHLNGGRPVGSSIPATEHSVMTAWPSEKEAILNAIDQYRPHPN